MSGHNKWSKVKHQKAATDAKKSKLFGQLAKLIASESKKVEGDVNSPGLKNAIDKAKKENMPKDSIERAVAKGKSGDASDMTPVRFEAYGPGGVALIVEALTDNNNRTSGEVKHILSKHGQELAVMGAAAWAFEKKDDGWEAQTTMPISDADQEKLQALVDALQEHDDVQDVYTNAVSNT